MDQAKALAHDVGLALGVVGHEGSTVIVVLNGLRLLRYEPAVADDHGIRPVMETMPVVRI